MKSIASFAMKSPVNAYALAAISAAFPITFWLSAALVGLVTLRRGHTAGVRLLFATLAGALGGIIFLNSVMAFIPVMLSSVAIVLLASVLRVTMDWRITLLSGTVLAVIFSAFSVMFFASQFQPIADQIMLAVADMPENSVYRLLMTDMAENNGFILVFTGGAVDLAVITLMLSRSWQSALYNPGGFRTEFHQLRLQPWMVVLLLITAYIIYRVNVYALEPAVLPLLLSGVALVHGMMAKRDLGGPWLIMFYVGMLLVPYMLPLVMLLAVIDSVADFRSRVSAKNDPGDTDDEV